jgi:hypothetical protein
MDALTLSHDAWGASILVVSFFDYHNWGEMSDAVIARKVADELTRGNLYLHLSSRLSRLFVQSLLY